MPTYAFRCPDGHEFDKFFRTISGAEAELPCPTCGKTAVRQISGGAGLQFKGSGFYLTDYGKNAHRTGGSAPAPDAGKSESTPAGGDGGASSSSTSSSSTSSSSTSSSSGGSTGGSSSSGGSSGGGASAA